MRERLVSAHSTATLSLAVSAHALPLRLSPSVSALMKRGGTPLLESDAHVRSIHPPRTSAPIGARWLVAVRTPRRARLLPFPLNSGLPTSRIHLYDLPQLRNSISRNPFLFNTVRIPGGRGYPGSYATQFQLLTRLRKMTASTFSQTPPRAGLGNACGTCSPSFGTCLSPARRHSQRKESSAPARRPLPQHSGTIPFASPNVYRGAVPASNDLG